MENRQTGSRKTLTPLAAKNLELKYRIVEETTLEKSPNFKPHVDIKTDLEQLRLKYFEKFGQHPHHRLGETKLKQLIEENTKQ